MLRSGLTCSLDLAELGTGAVTIRTSSSRHRRRHAYRPRPVGVVVVKSSHRATAHDQAARPICWSMNRDSCLGLGLTQTYPKPKPPKPPKLPREAFSELRIWMREVP